MISPSTDNEKKLLLLIKKSDEVAFKKIYELYSNRLSGYLFKLLKSEILVQEVLQDVFLRIWNNRQNIDAEKSFRSYLFRIAENLVYDLFRKAALDRKLKAEIISNSCQYYEHVEEQMFTKENLHLLQNAIDALPPQRRQVFRLCKIEGKSYDEVSKLLGISASTISDHIVKATKFLKAYLDIGQIIAILVFVAYLSGII